MDDLFYLGARVFVTGSAFIFAFILPYFSLSLVELMKEKIKSSKYQREYRNFMKPEYWFFRGFHDVPNKSMMSIKIENSRSREILEIGFDRKDIPNG